MNVTTLKKNIKPLFRELSDSSAEELSYFARYGIDLENQVDGISHRFGSLDCNGYKIACHLLAQENPEGTFFILHGYYDHVGLYSHILRFFLEQGYNVFAYDLPGHGLSSGTPATIPDFSVYTEILSSIFLLCADRVAKPWHGYGQSTGCAILTDHLLSAKATPLNNVVLSAPLVRPWMWPLSRIQLHIARLFIRQLPRAFTDNSRDKSFLAMAHNDPLAPRVLPIEWVLAMDRWIKKVVRHKGKSPVSPLVIQGTCDRTVDAKYNIAKLKELFSDPKVLLLKDARHHLPNELEETRAEYTKWLASYL